MLGAWLGMMACGGWRMGSRSLRWTYGILVGALPSLLDFRRMVDWRPHDDWRTGSTQMAPSCLLLAVHVCSTSVGSVGDVGDVRLSNGMETVESSQSGMVFTCEA